MAKIPLNYFRRVGFALSAEPQFIYEVPYDRASILLTVLATNVSENIETITLSISSGQTATELPNGSGADYIDLIKDFEIGAKDAANLTIGKMVLIEGDRIYAHCSTLTAINLNISILEAVNTR